MTIQIKVSSLKLVQVFFMFFTLKMGLELGYIEYQ